MEYMSMHAFPGTTGFRMEARNLFLDRVIDSSATSRKAKDRLQHAPREPTAQIMGTRRSLLGQHVAGHGTKSKCHYHSMLPGNPTPIVAARNALHQCIKYSWDSRPHSASMSASISYQRVTRCKHAFPGTPGSTNRSPQCIDTARLTSSSPYPYDALLDIVPGCPAYAP
jgi:hypothetical protein